MSGERACSVLQMLIDEGVNEQQAAQLVSPIIDWFDGVSMGLAEAMLPTLYAPFIAEISGSGHRK